jgi:hypothetical protein
MKKTWIPVVLALIVSLVFPTTMLAADEAPANEGTQGMRTIGQILSLSPEALQLETGKGERTILLDEDTRFRALKDGKASYDDLHVGGWVGVLATLDEGGQAVARWVIILPEDFDPSQRRGRLRGEIIAIDPETESFLIRNGEAGEVQVFVTQRTRFVGGAHQFDDLQPGMLALVVGRPQDDGSFLAFGLGVRDTRPKVKRFAGQITSVDVQQASFDLLTRRGDAVTFQVTEKTRFRSRNGSVQGLGDLQPEMLALVVASPDENGSLKAWLVIAGTAEDIPHFDLRAAGEVVSIQEDGFVVQTLKGEQVTLQVMDATWFKRRSGEVQGLEDLREGMRVLVGAKQGEGGLYHALIVLVGQAPSPEE